MVLLGLVQEKEKERAEQKSDPVVHELRLSEDGKRLVTTAIYTLPPIWNAGNGSSDGFSVKNLRSEHDSVMFVVDKHLVAVFTRRVEDSPQCKVFSQSIDLRGVPQQRSQPPEEKHAGGGGGDENVPVVLHQNTFRWQGLIDLVGAFDPVNRALWTYHAGSLEVSRWRGTWPSVAPDLASVVASGPVPIADAVALVLPRVATLCQQARADAATAAKCPIQVVQSQCKDHLVLLVELFRHAESLPQAAAVGLQSALLQLTVEVVLGCSRDERVPFR